MTRRTDAQTTTRSQAGDMQLSEPSALTKRSTRSSSAEQGVGLVNRRLGSPGSYLYALPLFYYYPSSKVCCQVHTGARCVAALPHHAPFGYRSPHGPAVHTVCSYFRHCPPRPSLHRSPLPFCATPVAAPPLPHLSAYYHFAPPLLEVWPNSGRKGLYSWQSMMGESGHAGRAI